MLAFSVLLYLSPQNNDIRYLCRCGFYAYLIAIGKRLREIYSDASDGLAFADKLVDLTAENVYLIRAS